LERGRQIRYVVAGPLHSREYRPPANQCDGHATLTPGPLDRRA